MQAPAKTQQGRTSSQQSKMPGRQRTFDLIPTTLVKSNGPKPPMTSKAAKKAYQLANRGPKISRAEQRRLDAEELKTQKKEYEREKAAAKSKAAREKKETKMNAEKEARRRMGVPEPSKFVRASQPTISRFVRSGNKRSWQEMERMAEESDDTVCEGHIERDNEAQPKANRLAVEDSEDEFGEFPSLSQSDLLEKIDSSMVSLGGKGSGPPHRMKTSPVSKRHQASQELPVTRPHDEEEFPFDDSQVFADMANTQLLSEAVEAAHRSDPGLRLDAKPVSQNLRRANGTPNPTNHTNRAATVDSQGRGRSIELPNTTWLAFTEPSVIEPPSHVSNNERKCVSFAPTPPRPHHPPRTISRPLPRSRPNFPPSATQVFLENHLDDFFPSPTQEIRELHEDVFDLPSNTHIAKEISPRKPIDDELFANLISTQELILSSQDLLEITTPNRAPTKRIQDTKFTSSPPVPREKHRFFEEKEDDLLQAAIHESKVFAANLKVQKVPLKEASGTTTLTLQRIQSAPTDYGDDELRGCSQELLALC